ncbi:MAG TPA: glycerol-3-phosphate dehydrogenase/oxidase [Bacilli bacterium]|nr:glycerol-3-phosphate dehydrogenase/oxidase [Bacilli bacterium]
MRPTFSTETRFASLREMEAHGVDLLVIGGGITGAGIAWDAALRGLRVGLVEQHDWAYGTSSRSTKLIHGGLRYLAQGEIALVREIGRERTIVHNLAPHLVHPMKLLLPIYKRGPYGKWSTSLGLWLYDRLAGVKRTERRRMLSRKSTLRREPGLRLDGLLGSGLYVEYRTDDSRLTLEVLKSAHLAGAYLAHYAQVTDLLYDDHGQVCGARALDRLSGREHRLRAQVVINATGPWVDTVRRKDGDLRGKRLHVTKGVHLTVSRDRLPIEHALYLGAEDGRMIFLIPREAVTYIGTTDTDYEGDLQKPLCTATDTAYLLRAVNRQFPGAHLTPDDVQSAWAGVRPLVHEPGKGPSELSRKEEIMRSRSGLYSIAGGKLTGFRKMAEKIVNLAVADLQARTPSGTTSAVGRSRPRACATAYTPLSGGDVGGLGFEPFQHSMMRTGYEQYGLGHEVLHRLLRLYGSNIRTIFAYLNRDPSLNKRIAGPLPILLAEVRYAVEQEMTVSLADYLIRRTGDGLFARKEAEQTAPALLEAFADMLGWEERERAKQWQGWQDALREYNPYDT